MRIFSVSLNSRQSWLLLAAIWTFGRFDVWTFAQSRQVPAPPQNHPVVIHAATIHTVSGGVIENGHVVFDRGVITAVSAGAPPRVAGAIVHDAAGLHVYPGLIAAESTLGLVETQSIRETVDHTEIGTLTPEVRAAVAVNPDSDLIPVARAAGILTAGLFPQGGAISGRCSVVRLDGWTWEDLAIDAESGLVVNWPRTEIITSWWMQRSEEEQRKENAENLKALATVFDDARAYLAAKDADPKTPTDLRFEAMRASLRGLKPIFVRASSIGQIESAVAWAVRQNVRLVIVGGEQADQCLPLLRKHNVAVIIRGTHRLPMRRHDAHDQPFALAGRLHEAGVRFAIASGDEAAHERNLPHHAATASAYGLPRDQALRAITLSAAQILGVGERLGSVEPGKAATIILTNGDPLQITTDVLAAWIDGRQIDLGNRQSALNAKYREKYRQLGLIKE
jgi:imidazolonepropionase-like amidohydrolase